MKRRTRLLRDKARWRVGRLRRSLRGHPAGTPNLPPFPTPARFDLWLTRGPSSRWAGFPTEWCTIAGLRISEPSRVAVVMHVFYPELVDEILVRLARIPVPFDLIVTNASGHQLTIERDRIPNASHCLILDIENRGRDIYPLLALVNADVLAPYQFILKVHTKRSPWRAAHNLPGSGETWRTDLLDALLPAEEQLAHLLTLLVSHPDVGVVTAPGSVLDQDSWGDNQPIAVELLRRLEMDLPERFQFAAGSMYWTRGFVLQGLRALNVTREDFEEESGQVNQTTAHAIERLIGVLSEEAGLRVIDTVQIPPSNTNPTLAPLDPSVSVAPRARAVPFYLPQFHTVDRNDLWWGPGFTEWTNVTATKPVFHGHWQPKLPRDLGFYNLEDARVLERQEELAREAGLSGFMFYHYWFSGERILEAPLEARLPRNGGLPFCIMWANENWTRRWDGRSRDVLLGQDYSVVPAEGFVESVLPELRHEDYLRIHGKPVLAVYRPAQIPEPARVVEAWRETARENGIGELFLLAVDVPGAFDGLDGAAHAHGFDGLMGFAPHNIKWTWRNAVELGARPDFTGNIFDYRSLVEDALRKLERPHADKYFPGVMTGFDNTARRATTPDIWYGSNPYSFRRWLAAAVDSVVDQPRDERVVFINAWNEWAEGAMLEPSDKFGWSYLQAVRSVLL